MGEVGGVQSRLDPPSHSVCYTQRRGLCVSDLAEEEGVLPAFCPTSLVSGLLALPEICKPALAGVGKRSREQVSLRVEAIVLGGVGCCNMVGEVRCPCPVVRG